MRIIALAALILFVVGFGAVSIGQHAAAYVRHSPVFLKLRGQTVPDTRTATRQVMPDDSPENVPEASDLKPEEKTFADFLGATERAFAAMDRTCLDGERTALGRAFHDLIKATGDLNAGKIELGDPVGAKGSDLASVQLGIYATVIDASKRGILQGRHFPLGPARLMHVQTKLVQRQGDAATARFDDDLQDLASLGLTGNIRKTRCLPL